MERALSPQFDIDLNLLIEAILLKYDYDFRNYGRPSMKRRVVYAMDEMDCPTLTALQDKILSSPNAFYQLVGFLTISVSEMFRDPSFFLALRERVIPHLKTYPSLKVWVAGCSTGEEVYSLAILLQEEELLERSTIYATDINPDSLASAGKGIFGLSEVQSCLKNYQSAGGKGSLSDYYTVTNNSAAVAEKLKRRITFADHSLVTDAVFTETHLILCRNVLIYFDRQLQDRALSLFHESLCHQGFLGLGSKETLQFSSSAKYFTNFVKRDRIFQKL